MSKYQAYPEYKDSEIEWLDDIPLNWSVCRLKQMLSSPMSYGANEAAERAITSEPRYIRITDMNNDGSLKNDTFRSLPWDVANQYLLKDLDILLARSGATVGKSFIYREDFGNCCYAGYLIKASCDPTKLNPEYAFWFFQSAQYWQYIAGSQIQATIQNVSAEKYGEMYLPLPSSINEQNHIAAFLDHETAKIDSLIEKQQQLIELLKEKRQAVISHAVTKGLNPDAPIKDSGVEWLGEVPEHWVCCAIKYQLFSQDSRRIPLSSEERGKKHGEYRYYGASGVIDFIDEYIFDESNVLVGEDGANLVNRNTPLAFAAHGKYWVNNHAHILKPLDGLADYWAEVIEIIDVNPMVSGSAQPKLTAEALNNLKIAFPLDIEERLSIESFIQVQKNKYDTLIKSANTQVFLLKERRTALISAAVTGKIDVRNWVLPTTSSDTNEATQEVTA